MANTTTVNHFKKYKRENRIQTTEESFSSGMFYSTSPLGANYLKEIINFDLKNSGASIAPRSGIQAYNLRTYTGVGDKTLFTAKDNLFILGDATSKKLTTCDGEAVTYEEDAHFAIPEEASIHNIALDETSTISRHIGTFGFNDNYYCFFGNKLAQIKQSGDRELLTPKSLTPKEAVMWGYNMLLENPYNFVCNNTSAGVNLLGLMPYDANNNLILSPIVNQTLTLKCFYAAASAKYKVIWEWKEVTASAWNKIEEQVINTSTNEPFKVTTSFSTSQIMVRITVFEEKANITSDNPLQVLSVGFNFNKEDYGSTANVKPELYDLSTCSGMTYWKNRLILYGVEEDKTLLFVSDINDPTYFPYPTNTDIFDEPIIHAIPYMDDLLVFTTKKLWMLTLSEDGLSWSKKLIQSNLYIKPWDLHLIKIVKNMVFFRSGNYYYMVVPKSSSTTGELTIAPISKQIEYLLNNFEESLKDSVDKLYNYKDPLKLVHYYNFLDYEDIHNVYVFETTKGVYLNYVLLYNSLTRYWRSYMYESDTFMLPYKQDSTQRGELMSIHDKGIALYKYAQGFPKDLRYASDGATLVESKYFPNYQLLDTGYRELYTDYKKRFREVQLKINNNSQQQLKFYSEFFIDGSLRKDTSRYKVVHHTDANDPKYGYLTLERELIEPSIIPGTTVLGETSKDTDCWLLDNSLFPEVLFWKIRMPVSGKGYSQTYTLISMNQHDYELLSISWIYRLLYSR